jgi:hypothetical protein
VQGGALLSWLRPDTPPKGRGPLESRYNVMPRAVTGQTASTRPFRTPTYQS